MSGRNMVFLIALFLIGLLIVSGVIVWNAQYPEENNSTRSSQNIQNTISKAVPIPEASNPGPAQSASTQDCFAMGAETFECYEQYYSSLVKEKGITPTFDDLKRTYDASDAVKSYCHQLTHAIGHAGANLEGGVGEAFALGDPFCWSGFYHGVMEEVLKGEKPENLPQKINAICADIPGKESYSFLYFNCVHGLGHGVMELLDDDLFASLTQCSQLSGQWERDSCTGGVFMENIMIESRGGISNYLKADDPLYPCDAVGDEYKQSCYLMQTSHMLTATNGDFAKVFTLCSTVEGPYKDTCYQSLGRDASGRTTSDPEKTRAYCMLGETLEARENCIIGAVKDFISYFHADIQARSFCASLDATLQNTCTSTATSYYKSF